jgi:hypothetical protein
VGNNPLQLEQAGLAEADAVQRGELAGIVLHASGSRALLGLALRGALGRLGQADAVRSFGFKQLRVQPALRGVHKLKVACDGEVCWMKPPIVFSVAEDPLWLLTPRASSEA